MKKPATETPDVFSELLNPLLKFLVFPLAALAAVLAVAGALLGGCGADRASSVAPLEVDFPSTLILDSPAPAQASVEITAGGERTVLVVSIDGTSHVPVPVGTVQVIAPWGVSWRLRAGEVLP